jgi:hypothetical protein
MQPELTDRIPGSANKIGCEQERNEDNQQSRRPSQELKNSISPSQASGLKRDQARDR